MLVSAAKNRNVAITVVAQRLVKIIWLLLNEKRPHTDALPDRSEVQLMVMVRRKVPSYASQG